MVQKPHKFALETATAAGLLVTLDLVARVAELVSGADLCHVQLVKIRTALESNLIQWKLVMVRSDANGRYPSGAHAARIVDTAFKSARYPASLVSSLTATPISRPCPSSA